MWPPAGLLVGVRSGDISSILRELKFGLSLAVPTSPPGVTADKLPSGDVFEARYSFLSLTQTASPARAGTGLPAEWQS